MTDPKCIHAHIDGLASMDLPEGHAPEVMCTLTDIGGMVCTGEAGCQFFSVKPDMIAPEGLREAMGRAIYEAPGRSKPWGDLDDAMQAAFREQADAALRARAAQPVATLPPIERNGARERIPLPGGWEIQTRGVGSSFRLCDTKTGDSLNILGGDGPTAQDFVTRMAREVHAASRLAAPPVVTDDMAEVACLNWFGEEAWALQYATGLREMFLDKMRGAIEAALG